MITKPVELHSRRSPAVFYFESSREAYDASQSNDAIRDGDILVVRSEGAVAVLLFAWPSSESSELAGEAFHVVRPGTDVAALPDVLRPGMERDYSVSFARARELARELGSVTA